MPTTRYVKASAETFGTLAGGFTSPDSPARRLADALKVAADGDTIRILDTAIYAEGELVVDRPLTIESAAAATDPAFKPTDKAFKPTALPRIRPRSKQESRVFRIQAAGKGRNLLNGPVVLRGLTIERGLAKNTQDDRAFGHGGGIVIVDLDDVRIERCCIRDNKTELVPFGEVDTVPFKTTLARQVGMIVLTVLRRIPNVSGIDDAGKVATAVMASIKAREAIGERLQDRRKDSRLAGQGSGGGACFVWSSGRMSDCLVEGNVANGRGAGVGVVGFGWPTIERCVIVRNTAGSQGDARGDGGGIGLEVAVPDKVTRDLKESNMLAFAENWLNNQDPSKLLTLVGEAGIHAIATRDFGELLNIFLVEFARAFLAAERWNHWVAAEVKKARESQVVITDCTVSDNTARDDGGGLYASVLSRFRVEGGSFLNNGAKNGRGGGLRVSMGSDAALSGVKIEDNHTDGPLLFDALGKPITAPGGGGIACRNVTLTLGGSRGGCSITKNTTKEWAGGGIIIEATSEGKLAGVPDLWHAILTEVFGVEEISATIDAATTVKGNIAGTGNVLESAKGGGLYILRSNFRAAPKLKVGIEQFTQNVSGNHGNAGTFVSKVTNKSIKTEQIDLVDEQKRVDDGDTEARSHLAGMTFRYES